MTLKILPLGGSYGIGNPSPVGGLRGDIQGWSPGAARRNTAFLYSVEVQQLHGIGDAVTLTLRDTPGTSDEWKRLLKNLLERLRRMDVLRWHYVVEWQRRGTPHLHLAVYSEFADKEHGGGPGRDVVGAWLDLARAYGASPLSQFVTPVTGPEGWLQYLSKHAARGARNYQRQGMPRGWDSTGRLWGHSKTGWPTAEPVRAALTVEQGFRLRRVVQAYAIASARSEAHRYEGAGRRDQAAKAWKRVAYLRRMFKDPERGRSAVRGFSEWVPGAELLRMAEWAGWQGELVESPVCAGETVPAAGYADAGASG